MRTLGRRLENLEQQMGLDEGGPGLRTIIFGRIGDELTNEERDAAIDEYLEEYPDGQRPSGDLFLTITRGDDGLVQARR